MPQYRFDFNKAAADLRAFYPDEAKAITLIDLSQPDAKDRLEQWLMQFDIRRIYTGHDLNANIGKELLAKKIAEEMSLHAPSAFYVKETGAKLVIMPTSDAGQAYTKELLLADRDKNNAAIFWHELGHLAIKGAAHPMGYDVAPPQIETLKHEYAADIFTALNGLAQGWLDIEDIREISARRAFHVWLDGDKSANHFTSDALDSLIAGKTATDFKNMTSPQITALAKKYMDECPYKNEDLYAVLGCFPHPAPIDFRGKNLPDRLRDFAFRDLGASLAIALSRPEGSIARKVAEKVLHEAIRYGYKPAATDMKIKPKAAF